MSHVLQEWFDGNMHRAYPLADSSSGVDVTGSFTIPSSLAVDIFMCVPNIPEVDITKFYISNITIRSFFIDISIGYDDPAVSEDIGMFKNIDTSAPLHSTYTFSPAEITTGDDLEVLYHCTGQIVIGDTEEAVKALGSWNFTPSNGYLVSTRMSKGLLNVQYISVNGRVFTGNIRFREGTNITLDPVTTTIDGTEHTVITVSASLNSTTDTQIANDEDLIDALVNKFGPPIQSINGILPDVDRNFNIFGVDCTAVANIDNGVALGNPCATPCCDEDANLNNILESIANLNLRYSQIKSFYDSTSESINDLQNKLLSLGSTL